MDRENADFFKVAEEAQTKFGNKCVPLQIPIGAHTTFSGVVDLLKMKAYTGNPAKEGEIPADIKAQADTYRAKLVEAVAGADDKLIEKYLSDEAYQPGRTGNRSESGSGQRQTGAHFYRLGFAEYRRHSVDGCHQAISAFSQRSSGRDITDAAKGTTQKVEPSPTDSLAALVFKTSADPYVGKLTYFRVYTGTFTSNSQVWNSSRNEAGAHRPAIY